MGTSVPWPCSASVVRAFLEIERLERRPSLPWTYLTLSSAVLARQALGALPVLTSKQGGSLDTLPRHGVGSGFSEAEDELISQTLSSPEGPALRVSAAAGLLWRQLVLPPHLISLNLPEYRKITRQKTERRGRRLERDPGS